MYPDLLFQFPGLCPKNFCFIPGNLIHCLIHAKAKQVPENDHPVFLLRLQEQAVLILHDQGAALERQAIHAKDIDDLRLRVPLLLL